MDEKKEEKQLFVKSTLKEMKIEDFFEHEGKMILDCTESEISQDDVNMLHKIYNTNAYDIIYGYVSFNSRYRNRTSDNFIRFPIGILYDEYEIYKANIYKTMIKENDSFLDTKLRQDDFLDTAYNFCTIYKKHNRINNNDEKSKIFTK